MVTIDHYVIGNMCEYCKMEAKHSYDLYSGGRVWGIADWNMAGVLAVF